jgi:uncharacterized repeat protein (TIGR03806 family)
MIRRVSHLAWAGLSLALVACPDPHDDDGPELDGGLMDGSVRPDGGDGDGDGDGDGGADGGVFGLDERPANPTCVAPTKPALSGVKVERVFPALNFRQPVGIYAAPGDDAHLFVIEQGTGKVQRFPKTKNPAAADVKTMLTLSVSWNGEGDEMGLLGLAFDPDFAKNGFVYVHYNPSGSQIRSVIDRYTLSGDVFDPATRLAILDIEQPYWNHKGGHIAFGPDKLLYIGFGDGGAGNDPHCFAQDPAILLGKFLRIDVRGATPEKPYDIPADNPYAGGGGRGEVYATGIRNPWRWSFDRVSGELWAGDVGQDAYEEVDLIEKGKNYGWKVREGKHCIEDSWALACEASSLFPGRDIPELPACDATSFAEPIWDYPREEGTVVTGGYVYRGKKISPLYGKYVYGDFSTGRISALVRGVSEQDLPNNQLIVDTDLMIASFGEDNQGELYVVDFAGGIHALVESDEEPEDELPALLSQTGCVEAGDVQTLVKGAIPYDVRVPFWSDGAAKQRWLAIPDGTHIELAADGDFVLPPGGVAIKQFSIGERPIETRFYVRWSDGSYGGYTYRWQKDGKDARLLTSSFNSEEGGLEWHYPSRAECERCHHGSAGGHIGIEAIQLDFDFTYPGERTANQLATLAHIDVLKLPGEGTPEPLVKVDDASLDLATRARAYLHANCAHCHRPRGTGRGAMDMRFHGEEPGMCNQAPLEGDLGIPGALIVAPGNVERSLLHVRMARRDDKAMPPLASSLVDESGAALVKAWIESLESCR